MITTTELWEAAFAFVDTNRANEFMWRTGVGRLWYAAYHDVASIIGYPTDSSGGHLELVKRARTSKIARVHRVAAHLDALRLKRQVADYRLKYSFAETDLNEMCIKAKLVRSELAKYHDAQTPTPPAPRPDPAPPEPAS